ncbi:hypothetical protein MJO28_002680 [Puccinia striiformis f. sp. tritici]|uniref:Uncharacterized protein n=1 Tax=Puccinia striiformis f. sp. tritici TaxID=168172 RepID=A0ACC0ER51_9BASI|nr:uncharacterized protein Pst134EA_032920 [Puccinia striiformis f. sp. tritici]XP_047810910.1 hypothetical protein Pst134EA_005356 [Puccinia striiformis f. sp. tritici]KAH9441529.1 hypothetical protein Pst134EA_032920 [Puccinia striiformis f. sp. tritici]KAH9471456.1 hypothetical protein Pst134EA_005356 [Puccinia striiformis f. sp. tritici]KAI7958889.1 hypothetical protein MJO28_002680 [Puccinia striiformis f. sp. tritici]
MAILLHPSPKFQVLAGPSADQLSPVNVNADKTDPFRINTDRFEGALTVRIKDFHGSDGRLSKDTENKYFEEWNEMTCSIQIQGRFLQETNADDCMWGNSFDRPIRDRLPYGTSVALKAISYIDPSLEHDIYSDKPWAWSPLLATMNHVKTERLQSDDSPLPDWEGTRPTEDCSSVVGDLATITSKRDRRRFLSSPENRQAVLLGPRDFINVEFVNGFVDYSTLRLQIPIVKLSFRLDKLWDGQPVRYECISRSTLQTYFVIVVQIVELAGKPVSV